VKAGKTVLLTGGRGFIGENFARHLRRHHPEHRLVVLDALTYATDQGAGDGWTAESAHQEFWYGDVCNAQLVNDLVSRSDVIVHMAAESHVTRSIYDDRRFFTTDVLGTQTLANAAVRHRKTVERFIHVSSSEVYGTALTPTMNEDHPLNPMSPYASAKCGADRLIYSYWVTYGLPAVIVRPFNTFGPRQHLEKAIPRFIVNCLLGEPITVHGDGSAARDWMFVGDLCRGISQLLDAPTDQLAGEALNFGTGSPRTVLEVARTVQAMAGDPEKNPVRFVGDRPGQVSRHTCDASKVERVLGWLPATPFTDALHRTIDWYQENENWWAAQVGMRQIPIVTADGRLELH
jgi:dTDP-glucose 4,6-dehydratase